MSIWQRLLAAIGRVLSAFFNIRIKLKYVFVLVILLVAGCIGVTYNRMINAVGGKAEASGTAARTARMSCWLRATVPACCSRRKTAARLSISRR